MSKSTEKLSIQPLHDRVVVSALAREEISASGIILPDTASREKTEQGTVVAVGNGKYEDGDLIPMTVKVGDTVLFDAPYGGPVKIDGQEYFILSESSILGILK